MTRNIATSVVESAGRGAVSAAASTAVRRALEGDARPAEIALAEDVRTVVNMTSNIRRAHRQLQIFAAGLSPRVKTRLEAYFSPIEVRKAFLGMNSERWVFRIPNLADRSRLPDAARFYRIDENADFREFYLTCADYCTRTYEHEKTRVKKKLRLRRKWEQLNNRKIFVISQMMLVLSVVFTEYQSSQNKAELVTNLRHILGFCQGMIDQCESGVSVWRSGGEAVSFPGTLQQIVRKLHRAIRHYETPKIAPPAEACEALIRSLDLYADSSLVIVLSHMLAKPVPMNTVYLLKKMHHVLKLGAGGDRLYEIVMTEKSRAAILAKKSDIAAKPLIERTVAERVYLEVFANVTIATARYDEKQALYQFLLVADAKEFDTPSKNRREFEPLLSVFRSGDIDEQAMLFKLLLFCSTDFRNLSFAVFDYNRIPTEYGDQTLIDLGLAPFATTPLPATTAGVDVDLDAKPDEPDEEVVEIDVRSPVLRSQSSMAHLRAEAGRVLDRLNELSGSPVEDMQAILNEFSNWAELNKQHKVGIVKILSEKIRIPKILGDYSTNLNQVLFMIKQIEKVSATLRVAVSLFKNLSQADINSLSSVVHAILQVGEDSLLKIDQVMRLIDRGSEHSIVNTIIQNTVRSGRRDKVTDGWHDNIVRTSIYHPSAMIMQVNTDMRHLKSALTKVPADHLAVRIGLFLQGASSLLGVKLNLPSSLLTLMQTQAMREISAGKPVIAIPAEMLDRIRHFMTRVQHYRDERRLSRQDSLGRILDEGTAAIDPARVLPGVQPQARPGELVRRLADTDRELARLRTVVSRPDTLVAAVSTLLYDALKIYQETRQSTKGYQRALVQVKSWIAELTLLAKSGRSSQAIVDQFLALFRARVASRQRATRWPGVSFDIHSFEYHVIALLLPHLDLSGRDSVLVRGVVAPDNREEAVNLLRQQLVVRRERRGQKAVLADLTRYCAGILTRVNAVVAGEGAKALTLAAEDFQREEVGVSPVPALATPSRLQTVSVAPSIWGERSRQRARSAGTAVLARPMLRRTVSL